MNYRNLAYTAMSDRAKRRNPADPIVIGVCAPKGSGKTVFADFCQTYLNRNIGNIDAQIRRDSFAGPLKEACDELFGIPPYMGREDKETPIQTPAGMLSPRQVWQKFGVGMREIFGEDFWVETLYHRWADEPVPVILIVDDVRFPNEARIVRERGGLVVGLKRPEQFTAARNGHVSESQMYEQWGQMIDLEVVNDGDFSDLREIACEVAAGTLLGCGELKIRSEQ